MITGITNACENHNKLIIYNNKQPNDKKVILPNSIMDDCFNIQFQNSNFCLFLSFSDPDIYCEISLYNGITENRQLIYSHGYNQQKKHFNNFIEIAYEVNRVASSIYNSYKIKKEIRQQTDSHNNNNNNNNDNIMATSTTTLISPILLPEELIKNLNTDLPKLRIKINLEKKLIIQVPKFDIVLTCIIVNDSYITHLLRRNNHCSLVNYDNFAKEGKCFSEYKGLLEEINTVVEYFHSKKYYKLQNCLFGPNCNDQVNCLYTHISLSKNCDNGLNCEERGCPFSHENKKNIFCKHKKRCRKMICYYFHPATKEVCKRGSKCRNSKCRFVH